MIRFIVETVSSNRDLYGNCYHFAQVTSTKTGKSLRIDSVGGESNASALVRRTLDLGWDDLFSTSQYLPKREWQRRANHGSTKLYEHNVTAKMLRALNRKG